MTGLDKPLNVLVVGAGMYVCGSGTDGFGTILPTLVQEQAAGRIGEIHIAATRPQSIDVLDQKLEKINARMETRSKITTYPGNNRTNKNAYKDALAAIPKPAAAIVSVPDHLHAAITTDVILAGVHPMVVKPLTAATADALQLVHLVREHKVYGAVEFHKRFDEANLLLRQKVTDGELGDICYALVEFSQQRHIRGIFKSWVAETNIFQYLGCHYADMVYFVTGAQPVRAMATAQANRYTGKAPCPGDYDAIQAVVEWRQESSGKTFVSTIMTNWIDPDTTSAMSEQKITMVGTAGRIRSDQKDRGFQLITQEKGLEDVNPYFTRLYRDNRGQMGVHGYGPRSLIQFLRDVEDVVAGKAEPAELDQQRPSFRQALVSTAVVEAVNRSLETGSQWITIDTDKWRIGN